MKKRRHALFALAIGMLAASTVVRAQGYAYDAIDSPSAPDTQVFGINNRGDAVGNGFDSVGSYPFVYNTKSGTFTSVANITGFDRTSILANSDAGILGGSVVNVAPFVRSGLIMDKRGNAKVIQHPDAVFLTQIRGISANGMAVGFRDDVDPFTIVGFIYDPKDGSFTDLIPSLQTVAQGINSRGEVVGSSVFLPGEDPCNTGFPGTTRYGWLRTTDGNITYFSVNGGRTSARGISDAGAIVGYTEDPFTFFEAKSFVTQLDGTQCQDIAIADEDMLAYPGSSRTLAQSINNSGEVVGTYVDDAFVLHGFIATPQ